MTAKRQKSIKAALLAGLKPEKTNSSEFVFFSSDFFQQSMESTIADFSPLKYKRNFVIAENE
jgi:hypothetical protein